MTKPPRTAIRVGSRIASFICPILALFLIILMILYWRNKDNFPLDGRPHALSYIVASMFFLLYISFTIQGNTFTIPCAYILFTEASAVLAATQVYLARSWRLLFRYKLQDIIQELDRLQREPKTEYNRSKIKKLTNSFYVKRRAWSYNKFLFKGVIFNLILTEVILAIYTTLKTEVFSQPNNCNYIFREGSAGAQLLYYGLALLYIPFIIGLSCMISYFTNDGYYIKQELRAFSIACCLVCPIYIGEPYLSDEISLGKIILMILTTCFSLTAFAFPIFMMYERNKKMSIKEAYKKAEAYAHSLDPNTFINLMRTKTGHEAMTKHLQKIFCSELALFFRQAEEFQQNPSLKVMFDIHDKFIGDEAIQEINLKASTTKTIKSRMSVFSRPESFPDKKSASLSSLRDSSNANSKAVVDIYDDALAEVKDLIRRNIHYQFRFPPDAWREADAMERRSSQEEKKKKSKLLQSSTKSSSLAVALLEKSVEGDDIMLMPTVARTN